MNAKTSLDLERPLVSIGMPVYNGERFLRQALDSLLVQDYENFELIISDNASTDRTAEICREYLARDTRILYYRNETNLGAVKNFSRVVELSRGKYFMWASDHDLWHPTFISRCLAILEDDPDVVLAYARTMVIDSEGKMLTMVPDLLDTRGMSKVERYKCMVYYRGYCDIAYGLIRKSALSTIIIKNILAPDHLLFVELALRGSFAQLKDILFYLRKNRPDEDLDSYVKAQLYRLDPTNINGRCNESTSNHMSELRKEQLKALVNADLEFFETLDAGLATFFSHMICVFLYNLMVARIRVHRIIAGKSK